MALTKNGVWHGCLLPNITAFNCATEGALTSAYQQQTTLLQAVLESSSDVVVFAVDRDYRLMAFNHQFQLTQQLLWGQSAIALGTSMLDVVQDASEREDFCQKIQRVLMGESLVVEDEYGHAQHTREYRRGFWSPVCDTQGCVIGVTIFSLNISDRRLAELELQQREQELRTLMDNTGDVIVRYDKSLRCVFANKVLHSEMRDSQLPLLGATPTDRYGSTPHAFELEEQLKRVFSTRESVQFEWKRPAHNGQTVYFLVHISPEFNDAGVLETALLVARDISELQASRERIHQMAFYDGLTGLPNRALLHERLNYMVQSRVHDDRLAAVLMVDMDQFKAINDTMGHAAGDALLKQAAHRLVQCVGEHATVARLGGDEFILLIPEVSCPLELNNVGYGILQQFRNCFVLDGKQVYVNCSIGIAQFPIDSRDPGVLLQYADSAMYAAKRAGRNSMRFYSREMTAQAQERLAMEMDLRNALLRKEMEVHYQPKVALAGDRLVGSEALLRWHHPVHGMVSPTQFISLAEELGLIHELGEWVLRQACTMAVRLNLRPGYPKHKIAINLSPRQFQQQGLELRIASILEETQCVAQWIELEITEGLLLADDEVVLQTLLALRKMGFTIAIDDFGTGYSSLSYLARFPIDTLKIDRSFIQTLMHSQEHAELVKAILLMANALNKDVVAEGVETAEQAAFLREHGCEMAQGYFYSKPLPAEQCAALPVQLPPRCGC
ncbi:EAL domain-containing protein [Curvibacter sp. CHRR-16]|uniref:putative bifunctional diguanylate cyclase/phosphodiesterase n=1 Tax=Curvibacter sp. CHRR-16 TaxID=2835872 RepID=UPI001BDB36EF|nr:bifunctional diguanylate cyclase/phosphodiesterase [Curvibacter sp. CHRR-16]MBT0570847.1 EAL domain-containing protein [Curvibacter sp. CHRR-16]